jgi:hypothetical protein
MRRLGSRIGRSTVQSMALSTALIGCLGLSYPLKAAEEGEAKPAATEKVEAAATTGHRFEQGEARSYISETKHVILWESAGDRLRYTTTISLELSCYVQAASAEEVTLVWRVLDVKATHKGPGRDHLVNSVSQQGLDDPLLGDLMVYHLVPLTVRIKPHSGEIIAVNGTQQLVDNLNKRHPAPNPASTPPRAGIAQKAFDPLQIATLFARYLAVPGSGDGKLNLGPAVSGHATLKWEGERYKLGLPSNADDQPRITLGTNPLPVELAITSLKGSGGSALNSAGVLNKADGEYNMTLAVSALTQDVKQEHTVQWQIVLLRRSLATDSSTDSASESSK